MYLFEINGPPNYQKQTRLNRNTGTIYNPSSKEAGYIQWQIRPHAPREPLTCAIEMHLTFYVPIPESTSKIKRTQMINGVILPTKKPDFDNLAYLVTNALKDLVYKDDALVTDCIIRKRYSDRPRTVIKIIPIDELQQVGGSPC